jgi:hypothetical protein
MAALWIVIGLIVGTICVSVLGAAFSIFGLAALFSGAALAIIAMGSALEFAKFVMAAYLHQRWRHLPWIFRSYLIFAIVTLSIITSMGIFGFLTDAYQATNHGLEAERIKLETLKVQQVRNGAEIARLNKNIEEIPAARISRRLKAREEAEPLIQKLTQKNDELDQQIAQANLRILQVEKQVGPLISIARMFHLDIDTTVKYLILLLVSVFDPLAICMVIATSESLRSRRSPETSSESSPEVFNDHPSDEIIQMKFVDDPDRKTV